MRKTLFGIALAIAWVAGPATTPAQAIALPAPAALNDAADAISVSEKVYYGYRRYGYGYRPWRSYGYGYGYRPWRSYGYGYGYRSWRPYYGYGYRPYYSNYGPYYGYRPWRPYYTTYYRPYYRPFYRPVVYRPYYRPFYRPVVYRPFYGPRPFYGGYGGWRGGFYGARWY